MHSRPGWRQAGLALAALAVFSLADVSAQASPPPGHWEFFTLRSGVHANPSPVEGVVYRDFITMPAGTPWLRLYFTKAWLEKGSYLRIVSLRDGDIMTMRQEHMEQWSWSSCYFNGNAVMVEIVAGPGTIKNFVEIDKVMAGDVNATVQPPETICGATDDRVPVVDVRIGRIDGIGCTGWIINSPTTGNDRCHLSAGHCASAGQILSFNVPGSAANCGLNFPPAARQFAIDFATSQSVNGGVGNDWWVFRCFPNPVSGLTTFQTQGSAFGLAAAMPAVGGNVIVRGFGLDGTDANAAPGGNASCGCVAANGTGTRNQTLQTQTGVTTSFAGTAARYQVDTCGGNSGSPVISGSSAIAIHTHGGCGNPVAGTSNAGTEITQAGLQAAITAVSTGATHLASDECNTALPVVNGTNGTYGNAGTTTSTPAFTCGLNPGNDAWFVYLATCTGTTTFDTCTANRTLDTVMQVWDGCGGTLLGCNDDMGTTCTLGSTPTTYASRLQIATTLGQRYLIRIAGYNSTVGEFDLNVTSCNIADECVDALTLTRGDNGPFSNVGSTTSAPAWPCGAGGNDVWFRYALDCAGPVDVTFSTCSGAASYDTTIEAFTGSCGSLASIGCNDDAPNCSLRSTLTVSATGPGALFVRVGGFSSATGTFLLNVSQSPGNQECANPIGVTNGINGPFCNIGATTSAPSWPCGSGGKDVWFHYTAGHTGNLIVTTCTATRTYDTTLQVFSGGCGALASLACNDDSCGLGSTVTVAVTNATQYWIRVGSFGGSAEGMFDLVLGGTASNDHCHTAVPVALGLNGPFTNTGSTTSTPAWPCGSGGSDVWLTFTAGCTAPHTFTTCTPARTYDTTLQIFDGGCGALNSLVCNDDTGGACGFGSTLTANLSNGVTYQIRVGGFGGATGTFELNVEEGTGTGSIVTTPNGCGTVTISVTGGPHIDGVVTTSLSGVVGVPFVGLGFGGGAPFCGCTIGHSWIAAIFGSGHVLNVPCNPGLIGLPIGIQGADFLGSGGCANPQISFTHTVTVTIG